MIGLIVGQVFLHAGMTGLRMAAPLQALQQGRSAWAVGVLLALFAVAPIVLALPAGRLADRRGYHVPMRLGVALAVAGSLLATVSGHYLALCIAAVLVGGGANIGMIAVQRTAGHMTTDPVGRLRIFSWLGLAPALANVVGPTMAGVLIDVAGFRVAFGALMLLPLATLFAARWVPPEPVRPRPSSGARGSSWNLLALPGLRRLLLVNWLVATSWDVHTFAVPLLGHDRGMSASTIGAVLGSFALAVAAVRLVIPVLAHRLSQTQLLIGTLLTTAGVFAVYPFAYDGWTMGACAMVLGVALGAVMPMVMSTIHRITPPERHGEAIALRTMTINMSSTGMPLLFGLVGAALGTGALFWLVGAAAAAGTWPARSLDRPESAPNRGA